MRVHKRSEAADVGLLDRSICSSACACVRKVAPRWHLFGEAQQCEEVAADDEARREIEPERLAQHVLAIAVPVLERRVA